MTVNRFVIILISYFLLGCDQVGNAGSTKVFSQHAPPIQKPSFALKNFNKGVSWVGGQRPIPDSALEAAQDLGINWLGLTPFGFMVDHKSPSIRLNYRPKSKSKYDRALRETIKKAKKIGFRVMLKPHLWLTNSVEKGWIGIINFKSVAEWQQWERDYTKFILHYARLAQEEGVNIFCIATELSKPVRSRPFYWKALIAEVRKVYSGKLTYAANWHEDYDLINLWLDLDYIGINAYFPLTDQEAPSVSDIIAGWKPHIDRISQLSHQYSKPVIFTEVGYKNSPGTTIRPWEWPKNNRQAITKVGAGDHDLGQKEQVNAYEALFRTVGNLSWFRGLFIWKWFSNPDHITQTLIEFSPQNKEAEQVLKRWYSK